MHELLLLFEILSRAGGSWESGRTTLAVFQLRYWGCSHAKCDSYATFDLNGYRFRTVLRFLSIRAEIFLKPHWPSHPSFPLSSASGSENEKNAQEK